MVSVSGFFNLKREIVVKGETLDLISAWTEEREADSELKFIEKTEGIKGAIRKGRVPGHKKSVFCVYA